SAPGTAAGKANRPVFAPPPASGAGALGPTGTPARHRAVSRGKAPPSLCRGKGLVKILSDISPGGGERSPGHAHPGRCPGVEAVSPTGETPMAARKAASL